MATLRLRQLVIHIPYDREKFIAIIITCIYNELIHYIKIQLCNKWNGHVLYIPWEILINDNGELCYILQREYNSESLFTLSTEEDFS